MMLTINIIIMGIYIYNLKIYYYENFIIYVFNNSICGFFSEF